MTSKQHSLAARQAELQQRIAQGATSTDRQPQHSENHSSTTPVGAHVNAVIELQALKKKLQELERQKGAAALIDSEKIHPTEWANRHASAFENADFAELCKQIEHTKGNIQPILVQPKLGALGEYEIIYGHRRHRANLKLGFQTRANVLPEPLSSEELFALMDAENRGRANPSAYEQGLSYAKALESNLYPSQSALAKALDVSPGLVSRVIALARTPAEVIAVFSDPMAIAYRQADALKALLEGDFDGVLARAKAVETPMSVDAALKYLKGVAASEKKKPEFHLSNGRKFASFKTDASGAVTVKFGANLLTEDQASKVVEFAKSLVEKS